MRRQPRPGSKHPRVAGLCSVLANTLASERKYEEAEREFRQVLALRQRILEPGSPELAVTQTALGKLLLETRQYSEAILTLEQALQIRNSNKVARSLRGETSFALARALWASRKDRTRALSLARQALADFDTAKLDTVDKQRAEVQVLPRPLIRGAPLRSRSSRQRGKADQSS